MDNSRQRVYRPTDSNTLHTDTTSTTNGLDDNDRSQTVGRYSDYQVHYFLHFFSPVYLQQVFTQPYSTQATVTCMCPPPPPPPVKNKYTFTSYIILVLGFSSFSNRQSVLFMYENTIDCCHGCHRLSRIKLQSVIISEATAKTYLVCNTILRPTTYVILFVYTATAVVLQLHNVSHSIFK